MTKSSPSVVWFRNDLRLSDNPALLAAVARGPVIPLFILDDETAGRPRGAASRWWLDKSLRSLGRDLAAAGAPLALRRGGAREVLNQVIEETRAGAILWNRLYDGPTVERDRDIEVGLAHRGLECRSFNAGLLNEPWDIKTGAGGPYKVFTPYWRAARAAAEGCAPNPDVKTIPPSSRGARSEDIDGCGLHPDQPDWSGGFGDWNPGEAGARNRLNSFLDDTAKDYAEHRDRPDRAGTSRLSPHLHFGEIGPRQVWAAAQSAAARGDVSERQVEAFLRELGWREFNHHLLFHFPHLASEPLDQRFKAFPWRTERSGLEAWRRGKTGFPIVDAGMRELWTTGWMHNRVRMIAASFLVKDLLIDWREGEAWFWDTLVDADPANNAANWQWVAGSGADAAPFFRVFNPVLQGEKFDPQGGYVRRWVPELANVPNALIHQPWRAEADLLGAQPGAIYPGPIVDHTLARHRALAAYETSK